MGIIRKKNPQTGEWEICGSTDAKDIKLIDVGDNFEVKNVEGALREMSDKLSETIADMEAHSKTLTEHSDSIEWLKVNGGGGGGGGGTAAPTITSTFEGGVVDKNEDVKIPIFFSSPNLGTGTAYVMIDNVEVMSVPDIKQGNNTINIGKLTNLKNQVAIYVKDRANMLSNQLSWEIIAGGIECEITFDDTADYFVTDNVVMLLNVTSASTEKIMMYITIDYDSYEVELQQGFNEYKFPSLDVGVHKVSFRIESGLYYTSEYIYNLVIVSTNSLYVSSTFQNNSTWQQGFPISVQYRISKASNENFTVKMYIDDVLNKTATCTPGSYYWNINGLSVGSHILKIEVSGDNDATQTLDFLIEVIASEYSPLNIIESGLIYRLSAEGRSNQDDDRENPIDNSGNNVKATLHNFNFFTNGWINEELVCDGNAYVEIDLQPWISNAIYGSTIEIQYTGLDIGLSDAVILDYTDVNTPYKGVSISLEQSVMRSAANTGTVSIDKDVETTISFVIDRENKFGKIYIDGICSRAFFLSDSGAGVNATREDFSHSQKIYLNCKKGKENFGACKIKDFRVYNRILSADEIVLNNIAQIKDVEQQEIVYNFNFNNTTLPTIRMYGDMKNMTLETPVPMRIKYTSPNEDKYGQSFDLPYCQVNWQGTSSLQYVLKNFTVRLKDESMGVYNYTPYENGILEDVYCFKCDYMESSHSRNVGIAKFVNDCLYDTKNPMQQKNSKVRNTVNGFPCIMYINDQVQGVYNFNLDRYSTKSYGYIDERNILVYEVSANSDTTAGAFYKWTSASGKDELSYYKSDFECLYPPGRAAGNDNMSELIRLIEWVNDSSDEDFKDNFSNYFNLEYVLRYYLFVLIFGAVDSLGKNMKLASFDGGLTWYPQVYDADTTIGLDNTGFLKFDMDIEMGDEKVFNTTGSMLWKRVVELFQAELKQQYSLMRQDRFTVENIMKYLYDEQIAQIPPTYYNLDMETKYLNFGSKYLYALHGSAEKHIKKWIRERIMYCDTLLGYNVSSSDYITLRSNKLGYVYFDIQTYIPMYVTVKWRDEEGGTGANTKRVGRGETVRFEFNMPTETDQEILIYAGYYLKSLGNVSNLQPTTMLIANASRLTEIECHSPNLINTDLSDCKLLQSIDLSDCTALGTGEGAQPTLNIQGCNYLRKCNCLNTKLTAIYTMPEGGNLEEIYYPSSTQIIELSNQKHLKVVGIPRDENAPQNLATVKITNCNNIETIQYPYVEGEPLDFSAFKYVQNLTIINSLDKLKEMSFNGFKKLINVELNTLPYLEKLGFDDMLPSDEDVALTSMVMSNCPLIDKVTFNVSSDNYKVAFLEGAKLDLGGMYSVTTIESNASIKGLETLIIPISTKELKFTATYGDGVSDIKSIWSSNAHHLDDGFVGIDLQDVNLTYLDMSSLRITNGINFHISPTSQHPHLNTYRDGVEMPYFTPSGSMDLTNYKSENIQAMYKGLDFSKFKVTTPPRENMFNGINLNLRITDLSSLFEGAKFTSNLVNIQEELNKYPNATNWSNLLKDSVSNYEATDIEIPTNKPMNLSGMYQNTNVSQDILLPTNVVNVNSMFKDCKNITEYVENWKQTFDTVIDSTDCYKGTGNEQVVPVNWGGQGQTKEETSQIVVNIPDPNYTLQLVGNNNIIGAGSVEWGDGTTSNLFTDGTTHTYQNVGRYTIKGNFAFGQGYAPTESMRDCLVKVDYIAPIIKDLSNAFEGLRVSNLDVSELDVRQITNMSNMFNGCTNLTQLNISNWSVNNVTNMSNMFNGCTNLTQLNISNWSVNNVTNMSNMFNGCTNLTVIGDITQWNTHQVIYMNNMFRDCSNLTTLNVSNLNTNNVNNMNSMFYNCSRLQTLDVSNWNINNVDNMNSMFYGCSRLQTLDVSDWNVGNVENMSNMFRDCSRLQTLDVSNWNVGNVESMSNMFRDCSSLIELNISDWDTSSVIDIDGMFTNCTSLQTLRVDNWVLNDITQTSISSLPNGDDERNVIYTTVYFTIPSGWTLINLLEIASYTTNASGILPTFNTEFTQYTVGETNNGNGTYTIRISTDNLDNLPTNISFNGLTSLLSVEFLNVNNLTTMREMFRGCESLESINTIGWNTSKVTSMYYTFYHNYALTELDVSNWNTSNVTDMRGMFNGANKLTTLAVSEWETGKVRDMALMFNYTNALQTLDVSNWNVSQVTTMQYMFRDAWALESLNISNWNSETLNNISCMFQNCRALTSVNANNWNISKVVDMSNAFNACSNLISLQASNWNMNSVTNMNSMFYGCSSLTSLDVSNWEVGNVTDMNNLFRDCSQLASIDVTNWDIGSATNINSVFRNTNLTTIDVTNWDINGVQNMGSMFRGSANLVDIGDISNWDVSSVTTTANMFEGCSSFTEIDVSNWQLNSINDMTNMFIGCTSLQTLRVDNWVLNDITQTSISSLPNGDDERNIIYATVYFTVPSGWTLINLLEIASYTTNAIGVRPTFNTEFTAYNANEIDNGDGTYTVYIAVNSLDDMPTTIYFREVAELLTVEKISVPGLTNIDRMIESCPNVTYINVSDLDVSQVTSMYRSLRRCNNLTTINVTGWDTRNVTSLYGTFANNPKLETIIGLEDWNVENVENFREICTGNSALQTFNIGNWRNNKNTTTYGMFYNCRALTELDMGGFDMGSLTSTTHMFTETRNLTRFNSPTNIGMSISFSNTQLDLESVLDIIDNLATVTTNQTLTLGSLATQLTEEQIAVAINKGWSIG